jgi:tRNA threonylcarbamoyladenosine biosynthesis protein TsaE
MRCLLHKSGRYFQFGGFNKNHAGPCNAACLRFCTGPSWGMINSAIRPQPTAHRMHMHLPDAPSATAFAEICSAHLGGGDTVLLSGAVGTGKSHFARGVIQHRLGADLDVPSPSFTLVQTYISDDIEIWHADLYRLSHSDELIELGLDEAIGTALCLIEWPDRLPELAIPNALSITFSYAAEGRDVTVTGATENMVRDLTARFAK